MACNRHKERQHGKVVPVVKGLAATVRSQVSELYNIESVEFLFRRSYSGRPKVRVGKLAPRRLEIEVCDTKYGEGVLVVTTQHPGAIARHIGKRLASQGITVAQ